MSSLVDLVLPLVGLVSLGLALSLVRSRVNLHVVASSCVAILFVGALGTVPVLAHLVMGLAVQVPLFGWLFHALLHPEGNHEAMNPVIGIVAAVWSIAALVRISVLTTGWARARSYGHGGVVTVDSSSPFAYVVPGKAGTVAMSRGLVETFSPTEIDVVLAHEQAHAEQRHDRLLFVGHVCVAVMPFLWPVLKHLEFSLERIADEHAVSVCGDRHLVARTLAKVALARHMTPLYPGISRVGVAARVRALGVAPGAASVAVSTVVFLAIAPLGGLALLQWHHVALAVRHVCGL